MRIEKDQKTETTKNLINTCEKTLSKPQSQNLPLKMCLIELSSNGTNVVWYLSLLRIGNDQKKREKGQNYVIILFFFRKELFSKS